MENNKDEILNRLIACTSGCSKPETPDESRFSDLFKNSVQDKALRFAEELTLAKGKFIFCESEQELNKNIRLLYHDYHWDSIFCIDPDLQSLLLEAEIPFSQSQDDFVSMQASLTCCEFLIARFGSIMVSSGQISGRRLNVFPPVHVVIAYTSQLVSELEEALQKIYEKYNGKLPSLVSVITGPSRTADIEKTLVMGAHGPKDLIVFLINDTHN